jgi:hypothetical protein
MAACTPATMMDRDKVEERAHRGYHYTGQTLRSGRPVMVAARHADIKGSIQIAIRVSGKPSHRWGFSIRD